ncbi:CFI-box-CTERM domain-containing protein [Noviherbaspirillum sp. ST9]|uniref:CFI-box-CTERM domain-containing protein n=1 Tax=Noviherbaspirillum sp. ST9 TaxID=3401606 RepID=UPI003B58707A
MADRRSKKRKSKAVSASALAQMGVCERLVVFEHRHGRRSTAIQRVAIRRGVREHDRFYRDGIRAANRKGRCYIATLMFGEGAETEALRRFRDRILRPYASGRRLIGLYYRTAPVLCKVLQHKSWLQPFVRAVLKPLVCLAKRRIRGEGGDHDSG